MNGFEAPIVQQALVSVNAVYDRSFYVKRTKTQRPDSVIPYVNLDPYNFTAKRHELAFTQKVKSAHLNSRSGSNLHDLPIFTSFNGMDITGNFKKNGANTEEERDELYRQMRKRVNFVGVNLTTINVENNNRSDNVSVMIGGMVTIQNTGPYRFGNMERVVWDVPPFSNDTSKLSMLSDHLPKSKCVALVLPYEQAIKHELDMAPGRVAAALSSNSSKSETLENERLLAEGLVELMEYCGLKDADIAVEKALNDTRVGDKRNPARIYLRKIIEAARLVMSEVDSRVIGTASNDAHPGETIDLLLRHGM